MPCNQLCITSVSAVEKSGGALRVATQVNIEAGVMNEGTYGCSRSGSVTFYWKDYTTGAIGPALNPDGAQIVAPGSFLIGPNDLGANATYVWVPPYTGSGYIQAVLAQNPDDMCNGTQCGADDPTDEDNCLIVCSGYTKIYPAKTGASMRRRRDKTDGGVRSHFGFGLADPGQASLLHVRAVDVDAVGLHAVVKPDVRVAVAKPDALERGQVYHSGPVVPGTHVPTGLNFNTEVPLPAGGERQGVLEVAWPSDSLRKRAVVQVWQTVGAVIIGEFTIGLRNVRQDALDFLWS
jgi:hypothetical protein